MCPPGQRAARPLVVLKRPAFCAIFTATLVNARADAYIHDKN